MSHLDDLSRTLWRQRQLMERLLYRLEVQQLLLAAGRTRWIATAAHDVEQVMAQLRQEELARSVQVGLVGPELGVGREATLAELVAAAPPPWGDILGDHQQAFLELTAEVEGVSRSNRELLNRGYQATREVLALLTGAGEAGGYSAAGSSTSLRAPSSTIDGGL